MYISIILFL